MAVRTQHAGGWTEATPPLRQSKRLAYRTNGVWMAEVLSLRGGHANTIQHRTKAVMRICAEIKARGLRCKIEMHLIAKGAHTDKSQITNSKCIVKAR